ncbi:MAG: histidine phosphatase family protein [Treponema sp.]|nr:histidine phosphatase family protein [Treponema sp.]
MEVYIIRHGKTDWNKEYRFQGAQDIPLNQEGRDAAFALGKRLAGIHFDAVYSSPLSRAYETACIVAETSGALRQAQEPRDMCSLNDPVKEPLLTELSFGEFEGLPFDQWMNTDEPRKYFFKEPGRYVPPKGGETFESGIERTGKFVHTVLEPLYEKNPGARIMIVAHGAILAALMCNLEGRSVENYWGNGLKGNCEETIYKYDGKTWQLVSQEKARENPYMKFAENEQKSSHIITKRDVDSANRTAEVLKAGGVVIIPTDTVYGFSGIAVPALNTAERIRAIKGRAETKPMIQLIACPEDLSKYTSDTVPANLLQKWPGALTIIVNDNRGGTTAFRCPGDEWLRRIIALCGAPIYSTSVNRSGQPVLDEQVDIIKEFGNEVDLIVTDGNKKGAKPSTIVSITEGEIKLLRQGDVQL